MTKNWMWMLAIISVFIGSMFYSLSAIILPFLLGFIGAYALDGLVTRMGRIKISRGIGSAILIFGVILLLTLLMIVAFPYLQQQLISLALGVPAVVNETFDHFKPFLEELSERFGTPQATDLKTQLTSHLGDVLTWSIRLITNLLTNSMILANVISLTILTPIIMFYLLKDWPKLIDRVDHYIPVAYLDDIRHHAKTIDKTLSEYAKGQATVCLILMVFYACTLWLIGLNQGVFIGILTGFLSFIPYVGWLIGFFTSIALALTQFDSSLVGMVFITFFIVGMIESNFLSPRLIGEKVGLHPVWIIFSLLAGATWFGFMGVLLALPIAATIGVIVRIALEWYLTSSLYKGMPQNKQ